MSNNNNRPKRSAENSSLVRTVTSGPVMADIYRGVTPDGHSYLYYVLSRAWRPQSGIRENYSNRLYERNEPQVVEVSRAASEWIRQNPRAADQFSQRRTEKSPEVPSETTQSPTTPPTRQSASNGNGRDLSSDAA